MADISTVDIVDQQDLAKQVDAGIAEAKRFFDYILEGKKQVAAATTISGITSGAQTANNGVNGASATSTATKALQDNTNAQKANDTAAQGTLKTTKQITLEQAKQNEQIKELNKNTRDQAREALGLTDAYAKLTKQQKDAEKSAKDLQAQALNNPSLLGDADAASKKANDLNDALKKIDVTVGNYQKNVGNYSAAAQQVVDALDKEQEKLKELQATKISIQNAGSQSFNPGSVAASRPQITGFAGGNTSSGSININNASVASIDAQISKSRTIVTGFQRELDALSNTSKLNNFTAALTILKSRYDEVTEAVNKNIAAGKGNSNETQELIDEQAKLTLFVNQQQKGFLSLGRELQTTTKQLQELADANLQNSSEYKELNEIVIEQTRRLRELRNDQALLSSEAPKLSALTIAAKGLAGAYAAGAGAVALFGDEGGKLEEKLNQLVGIQTLLQGLMEFSEFLTKKSAISTALFGESLTLSTNAEKKSTQSIIENTKALEEQSVAQIENTTTIEENTAGKIENIVTDEGVVAGTVETIGAIETQSAVTKEATASTFTFASTLEFLAANPIIIALAALAGVLLLVYENLDKTHDKLLEEIATETQYADAINRVTDAQREQINLTNESTDAAKKEAETKLASLEAQGASQEKLFSLRKQILGFEGSELTTANAAAAKQNIDQAEVTKSLEENIATRKKLLDQNASLATAAKGGATSVDIQSGETFNADTPDPNFQHGADVSVDIKDQIKDNIADIEKYDTVIKSLQTTHDSARDLQNRNDEYDRKKRLEAITEAKFNADQLREITLNNANEEYNAIKQKNDLILSDTKSSLDQRLAAIQNNFNAEKQLRELQNQLIQNDISKTPSEKANSAKNLKDFEGVDNTDGTHTNGTGDVSNNEAKLAEIKADIDKYLALQQQINAAILTADSALQSEIFNDQVKSFADRTLALGEYNLDQQSLIINAGNAELEAKGLFDEEVIAGDLTKQKERIAIEQATNDKLTALALKSAKDQRDIIVQSNNQLTADIDRVQQTNLVNKEASDFKNSSSNKKFNAQKAKDERQATIDKLNNDLVGAQNQANDKTGTDATRKAGADSATDIQNNITANNTANAETDRQKKEELVKNERTAIENVISGSIDNIGKLEDAQFDATQARLSKELKLYEDQAAEKESSLKNSTLNSVEAQIAIQKAEKDAAEKRREIQAQEQANAVKKAQFDKAAGIAKIILNTAIGVTAQLEAGPAGIPLAAAAAALGAIELAVAIAQPIPSYAEGAGVNGRPVHPGGMMRVGEAGKEQVIYPGGKSYFVDQETFVNAPQGAIVKPLYGQEAEDYTSSIGVRKINLAAIRGNESIAADRMANEMGKHSRRIERAVSKIPVSHTTFSKDIRASDYIKKVVRGQA